MVLGVSTRKTALGNELSAQYKNLFQGDLQLKDRTAQDTAKDFRLHSFALSLLRHSKAETCPRSFMNNTPSQHAHSSVSNFSECRTTSLSGYGGQTLFT